MKEDATINFLSKVKPFHILPDQEIRKAAQNLIQRNILSDVIFIHKEKTILDNVYILFSGKLEQYIQENGEKKLVKILESKDLFGGISILFNRNISLFSVKALEQSSLYSLSRDLFLYYCSRHPEFVQYFCSLYFEQLDKHPNLTTSTLETAASQNFLNLSLQDIFSREVVSCNENISIQKAAGLMSEKQISSLLIKDSQGKGTGLVTDNDLRRKVVSTNFPVYNPVGDIASRPLVTQPVQSLVFEGILQMMKHRIRHLVITDESEKVLGIVTDRDLLLAHGSSAVFLMQEIQQTKSIHELETKTRQLPVLIKSLLDNGAKAGNINRIITEVSDTVLKKIIGFALKEAGEQPVPFVFMIMGSEGRKEQTLKTDQDNAILYEDVDADRSEEIQNYFLQLGDIICTWLDQVGYSYCRFDIMAQNPKWCQPLSVWKRYFWEWIHNAEPKDLLFSSIFFDFRTGYGDRLLIDELRSYLFQTLGDWQGFFRHLAENALRFKPPLDIFGNIALKYDKDKKGFLDIKQPMQMLVDFARIYALRHKISETNTMDRLEKLRDLEVLDKHDHGELAHAYSFMMHVRLCHQAELLVDEGRDADNLILPGELTYINRQGLKEAFKRIRTAQGRMRMDLTHDIGIT